MDRKPSSAPSDPSPQRIPAHAVEQAPSLMALLVAGSREKNRRESAASSGTQVRRGHYQPAQGFSRAIFPPALAGALPPMSFWETIQAAVAIIDATDRGAVFDQDDDGDGGNENGNEPARS